MLPSNVINKLIQAARAARNKLTSSHLGNACKKECKEGVAQPGQPKTARINLFSVFIHLFISIGGICLSTLVLRK